MRLESRLKQLELKMKLTNRGLEQPFDIDQYMTHLGLDPMAARESARSMGKSIVEAMCGIIGIEPREFIRLLKEKANLVR